MDHVVHGPHCGVQSLINERGYLIYLFVCVIAIIVVPLCVFCFVNFLFLIINDLTNLIFWKNLNPVNLISKIFEFNIHELYKINFRNLKKIWL